MTRSKERQMRVVHRTNAVAHPSLPNYVRGVGDEGGGRTALIAAGGAARRKTRTAVPSNHYALLRTVEAGFGLSTLGDAGKPTTPVLRRLLEPTTR
jgi:hypothetical protein